MGWQAFGDWGTSRLRLFRVEQDVPRERCEGPGIGALDAAPETVLREALAAWRRTGDPDAIRLTGMVGSRNGWVEAPYAECPIDAAGWARSAARLDLDGIPVVIGAGLACTRDGGAHDVMRGEETQIFGALQLQPALATGRHLIALPGTHSKWADVENGTIVGFRTFFTGETFALLRDHSTLMRAGDMQADAEDEAAGFGDGLARAAQDSSVIGTMFEARAAQLRAGRTASWALGFLSGLLIGSEVGVATAAASGATRICLIGDPRLVARYERALAATGLVVTSLDGDACALAGLELLGGAA
jgi:2-dehydro-3-deoxygalactonokinase